MHESQTAEPTAKLFLKKTKNIKKDYMSYLAIELYMFHIRALMWISVLV